MSSDKIKTSDTLDANKPRTTDALDGGSAKTDGDGTVPLADKSLALGAATTVPTEEIKTIWAQALTYHSDPHRTIKHRREPAGKWSNLPVKTHLVAWDDKNVDKDDDFQLSNVLGEGGMGIVYQAKQTAMDRMIAVKMLKVEHAKKSQQRSKFLSEAVVTGNLEHPNIVPVYDIGTNEQGQLFYAMKHVHGTPWNKVIKDLTQGENIDVLMHVADAAAFAHSRGMIHRDLKPDNVMLGEFGEVLVMDWGMALSVTKDGKADELTRESAFGGTPAYMAPEMASGDPARIGFQSDVYLLGGILYEILTGQKPHSGTNINVTLEHALGNVVQPTKETGELLDIAMKAMASNPEDRYQSVKDFQAAIRDCQSHSESISLVSHARRDLDRARVSNNYEDFSSAVFGFREALEQWTFNERARRWLAQASLEYAECAFEKGDLDLALSLLKKDEPTHAELLARVAQAKQEEEQKQDRLKYLGMAIYGLGLVIVILLVGSFLYIKSEKDEKYQAEEAKKEALKRELDTKEKLWKAEQNQWKSEQEKQKLTEKMAMENRRIWRSVFEDDFSDTRLDARWQRFGGKWEVKDGQLRTTDGKPAAIFLRKPYPGDLKVEFDCGMNDAGETQRFSVFMTAMPKQFAWNPDKHVPGYEFVVADSQLKIQKYGKEYAGIVLPPAEAGKDHKIVVERRGSRLSVSVDDKTATWEDPNPLTGSDSATLGLADYNSQMSWKGLKIYELSPPIKADLLETAQRHLQMGHYITARDLFEEVLNSSDVPDRLEQAKLGLREVNLNLTVKKKNDEIGPLLAAIYPGSKPVFTIRDGMIVLDLSNSNIWNLRILAKTMADRRFQVDGLILDNNNIDDLSPLSGMRLKILSFNKCKVRSLAPLKGMPLESLYCSDNAISSLDPLMGMKLTRLDCSNNKIGSLQPLAAQEVPEDDQRADLQKLIANQNPPGSTIGRHNPDDRPDVSEGMKLVNLKCDGNHITTLAPLQDMPLTKLSFARNQIKSLEPIKGKQLTMIHCWGNPIIDYSPLATLPDETQKDCPWVLYLLGEITADELLNRSLKDSNGELYYQVYIATRCETEGDTAGAIKAYEAAASSVDPYINAYAGWKLEELRSKSKN